MTTSGPPRPRSIVACFADLPDPRVDRTRAHQLTDILVIGLCAIMTVGESFTDMELFGSARETWRRAFLELRGGIPSHDTFRRVFSALDPQHFLKGFATWVQGVCTALGHEVVAIDGKALRRAANADAPLPHIVSAWATGHGLTLAQVRVDDKSNEITAIPELLQALALEGCIVTIDAMGCQKEIAARIVEKRADYVLALKGNQGTAHDEFREYFDLAAPRGARGVSRGRLAPAERLDFFASTEKGHGRVEVRRCWQTTDIDWFQDKKRWPGLASAGMIEARRTAHGQTTVERRYYLSSLPLGAEAFAQAVRAHWGVENALHWSLDVTFREDLCRARTRHAAENLAALRRLALNLLKRDPSSKASLRQKRALAALDMDYLKRVLGI